MLKDPITKRLVMQMNIQNITNTYYDDELYPYHIILGSFRSTMFSLSGKF